MLSAPLNAHQFAHTTSVHTSVVVRTDLQEATAVMHTGRQHTFHTEKEWGSTTVGCTTSLPGNTPHVTALTLDCPTLLRTCTMAVHLSISQNQAQADCALKRLTKAP